MHTSSGCMKEQIINHFEISQPAHVSVSKVEHETRRLHHPVSSYDSNMTHGLPQDSGPDRSFSQQPRTLSSNEQRKVRRRKQLIIFSDDLIVEVMKYYHSKDFFSRRDNRFDIGDE